MDYHSRISVVWLFSLVVLLLISLVSGACEGDNDDDQPICIGKESVLRWANVIGENLNVTSNHYSGVKFLRKEYEKRENELNLTRVEGADLLESVKTKISDFLQLKVVAVQRIVEALEKSFANFPFGKEMADEWTYVYLNALNISMTEEWVVDQRFESQYVLLTNSTIHVPTVVYDKDFHLLREIQATNVVEKVFVENFERDHTLKWQYYGSKTGFLRNFPGIEWTLEDNLNLFDCRQRKWYSQAIAPPKTVLFLVDMTGSQTGLAIGLTHLMVSNTLDSLGENDYFNIMTFNDSTKFVDKCYEDRFLEATHANREHMKRLFLEMEPKRWSEVCNALNAAFDVLEEARSGPNSNCSEVIMLFTDGVELPCDEVFAERNKNRTVRVFTYLLGESNQHAGILTRIACSNGGKYTRITVRSDVPEKVADYLPVMARPLVQEQQHPTIWSNTYRDFLSNELVFTVSQIVHNSTVKGLKEGLVAGVASVDVPVTSLLKVVPPYKLGVNGYMFMITNNGFITYHPDRKSMHQDQPIEDLATQDITDVEQSQQFDQELGSFASEYDKFFGDFDEMQLRRNMIDRKTGRMKFPAERPFDDMKRLKEVDQTYYYTDIPGTSFSLAVVLTEDGGYQINPVRTVNVDKTGRTTGDITEELGVLTNLIAKEQVKIAEWLPCWLLKPLENGNSSSPVEYFKLFLDQIKNGTDPDMESIKCDIDWTNLLLLDLRVTANFSQHWNFLYNISSSTENPFGVDMIKDFPNGKESTNTYRDSMVSSFLATVGGLNLYYDISENGTEGFVIDYPNTVTEGYFARSVNDVEEGGFVYSFPPKIIDLKSDPEPAKMRAVNDAGEVDRVSAVTAYSAVKVNGATVAVAGHQMTVKSFGDLFRNAASSCDDTESCDHNCSSEDVTCLLIDNDGYLLATTDDDSLIGQHLAFVNAIVFHRFVEFGIMYRRNYADYQALCKEETTESLQSSFPYLLNMEDKGHLSFPESKKPFEYGISRRPLSQMKNLLMGFVQNAILMLTTFGWYDWLVMMTLPSPTSPVLYQEEAVYLPCDQNYTYYKVNRSAVWVDGREGHILPPPDCSQYCKTNYVLAGVPATNLVLIVITQTDGCPCPGLAGFEHEQALAYNTTEENTCNEQDSPIYRRPLPNCVTSTRVDEESKECGSASFLEPSKFLLFFTTFHLLTRFLVA